MNNCLGLNASPEKEEKKGKRQGKKLQKRFCDQVRNDEVFSSFYALFDTFFITGGSPVGR